MHLRTRKNLHSHNYQSPLSQKQEVSAFGDDGEGDDGDLWEVRFLTEILDDFRRFVDEIWRF